jgi:hypothetical protein
MQGLLHFFIVTYLTPLDDAEVIVWKISIYKTYNLIQNILGFFETTRAKRELFVPVGLLINKE